MQLKKIICLVLVWSIFGLITCSQQQKTNILAKIDIANLLPQHAEKVLLRQDSAQKSMQLDTFFHLLQKKAGFNGVVLVAQHGKILYQGAFGYANLSTKDTLNQSSVFQLASVSKQFTAVAILQLVDKGLIYLDDPVQKYIPSFPYDYSITVRSLLCHRSGLPNYVYSLEKHYNRKQPLSNTTVVEMLAKYKPAMYLLPNRRFQYSNTNYVLLAYIVEQLSGKSFREYAQENLFIPADMSHTFVFDGTNNDQRRVSTTGYTAARRSLALDYTDSVVGDKSVYSTAEDLYKWDRALYNGKILSPSLLALAFQPQHPELKTHNYGMGFRLKPIPNWDTLVFHGGWWHGFKNYFMRHQQDQSTIIVLGNVANHYLSKLNIAHAILYPEKSDYFLHKQTYETEEPVGGGSGR